ncbi:MAG: esterase-like activity of phytase family protein, partial [Rhodocyclaceae bacterium]|nr:esterase-like activity of phytase family protein [Rhodocyclaceae bacterium]
DVYKRQLIDMTYLRDEAGRLYAPRTVDPEAIRFGLAPDTLWWASEGEARRGIAPAITKIGAGGMALQHLAIPAHYLPGKRQGVRDNLAFESLAIDRVHGRLYVGVENALHQDGQEADVGQPSPARILVYDLASSRLVAEYVYVVDAVPQAPPLPLLVRTNGLVELLSGEGMPVSLERTYVQGSGTGARLYRLELEGAGDVSAHAAGAGVDYQPIRKTLLLDLGTLGISLDNLEGMSWGPRTAAGRPSLLLVSDDNFSPLQQTQFLAFELHD